VLPATQPTLPEPVDGLWLTSMSIETRVITGLPGLGWIEDRTSG
jgi:hypothetical protein